VRYKIDPTMDYPRHFSGHVKIVLDDGSALEENQAHPRGGFEEPLPPEEIKAKFRANARLALPQRKVDAIIDVIENLEKVPVITRLTDLLNPV